MQTIDKYNSDLGTAVALVGGAGAGKTSLGLRLFPATYIFVADPNFKSGLDYLRKLNQSTNIIGFDLGNLDDTGKKIPSNLRYDWMLKCLNAAVADKRVQSIFVDSGTFIEDIIKAKICGSPVDAGIKLSGFEQWGQLQLMWKSLIMGLRQEGKKVVFSFHESKERDESDQVYKYKIAVDGQISSKIPAMFSDVLRCEVGEPATLGAAPSWNIRPIQNVRQEHLKNTYGLTKVISQDDFVKLVQSKEPSNVPSVIPSTTPLPTVVLNTSK